MSKDLTGRSQLVRNVVFSWGGQFVFIVAGFVLPRMIDANLGQELLGVWDFAWSMVTYFGFVQGGITSAVNRYVGRDWAKEDTEKISRTVSCASLCLVSAGVVVGLLTWGVIVALPWLSGAKLGEHLLEAQVLVGYLGATMAVQTALGAFNGVVTGCHRWDLKNINHSFWHFLTVVAMIVALQMGGGLRALAICTFAGGIIGELTRVVLAFHVCRGLRLSFSFISLRTIKELYWFGAKTLVPTVSDLLRNSTTSLLIITFLGPAPLALFTRPRSLLRQVETVVRRMTMTLIPSVSSLQASNDRNELRQLAQKSVRYTLYLVLPPVLILGIFGGVVLEFWMGPGYANNLLIGIIAFGCLPPLMMRPILDILMGMNAHGRVGLAQFVAALVGVGLTYVALGPLGLGLEWVAVAVVLPLALLSLFYYPQQLCYKLQLGVRDFFRDSALRPFLQLLPFAAGLLVARLVFAARPEIGLLLALAVLGPLLGILYWKRVLPDRMKSWLLKKLPGRLRCSAAF